MLEVLAEIGKVLNEENIRWALGASLLLNRYGLEREPHDIDLFVDLKHSKKTNELMLTYGKPIVVEKSLIYATEAFYRYNVKGMGVDVMGGFQIRHDQGIYRYQFDDEAIVKKECIQGVEIPLTALEDWYIMYQLLPNRGEKVDRIEEHLKKRGIKHPHLLTRALRENLPKEVEKKTYTLLTSNI